MTVVSQLVKHVYQADGVQTEWPVQIPFFMPEEIRALVAAANGSDRALAYGTEYTVIRGYSGATLHTVNILPKGEILTVYLDLPFTQELDLRNNGLLDAEQLESAFDRVTLMCQNLRERLSRAWVAPLSANISGDDMLEETRILARSIAASAHDTRASSTAAVEAATQALKAASDSVLPVPQKKDIGKVVQIQNDLSYGVCTPPTQATAQPAEIISCKLTNLPHQTSFPACWSTTGLTLTLDTREESFVLRWSSGQKSRIDDTTLSLVFPEFSEKTRVYIRLDIDDSGPSLSWTDIPCEYSPQRNGWAYPSLLQDTAPSFGTASSDEEGFPDFPCQLLFTAKHPAGNSWKTVNMASATELSVQFLLHKQRRITGVRVVSPEAFDGNALAGAAYLEQLQYGVGDIPDQAYPVEMSFAANNVEEFTFFPDGLCCKSLNFTFTKPSTASKIGIARIQPLYTDDWFNTNTNKMYSIDNKEIQRLYVGSAVLQGSEILEFNPVVPGTSATVLLPENLGLNESQLVVNPFGTGCPVQASLEFFVPFIGWIAPGYEVYQETLSATGSAGGRVTLVQGDLLCTTGTTTLISNKHALFGLPKSSAVNLIKLRARVQVQRLM